MKYSLGDKQVKLLGQGHFIAPNAAVIGDVTLHDNVSVWFSCVLRGDADRIEVGAGSNIQDGTVMHADPGYPMIVGENVTVGHSAMLHGCTIGDEVRIGPFVEIQKEVVLGNRVRVQSHTFVCSNVIIENDVFIGHNITFVNDRK